MQRKRFGRRPNRQHRSADAYRRQTLNRDQYKYKVKGVPLKGRGFRYGHLGTNAHSVNFGRKHPERQHARLKNTRTRI